MGKDLAVVIVAAIVIFGGAWAMSSMQCSSQWERSHLKAEYGPIQGCLVELPDGRWLPADRVREVDIAGSGK